MAHPDSGMLGETLYNSIMLLYIHTPVDKAIAKDQCYRSEILAVHGMAWQLSVALSLSLSTHPPTYPVCMQLIHVSLRLILSTSSSPRRLACSHLASTGQEL